MDTGPAFHVRFWDIIISITVADPRPGIFPGRMRHMPEPLCVHIQGMRTRQGADVQTSYPETFLSSLTRHDHKQIDAGEARSACPAFPSTASTLPTQRARPQWTGPLSDESAYISDSFEPAAQPSVRVRRLRPRCHRDRPRRRTPVPGSARNPCGRSSPCRA